MNNAQQVTTGKVRLSYTHVFAPYAHQPNQEAKYSTTVLVPKSDIATKQRIDTAINAAIEIGIKDKWGGVRPPILAIPVHDGDGTRPSDGMPFGQECKGHWVFTASSKQPIAVVDTNLNPIINQSEVYSGVYARICVTFFPYNSNGKKGIGIGLGPIQKIEDGEPLGGGVTAEQAFGGTNAYMGAPQQSQPQQPQPQPQQPQQQYDPITGAPITPGGVMGI
ncbi:DUF2815 family protein [Sporanaerobacter sp. PP17-6a]|uniref:DUF2815 family protein n=1 Tax=Sporanaerobacter sp. PP17-6a TaxID=1891289 RepID=UPI0008A02AC0|nr:DUF2815 family protein [Sporanaerobacter sp. PP17-6a]SCL87951.1 hypothetical protein PP176A_1429 [Sporanaerobacter sp. PP17-6a]